MKTRWPPQLELWQARACIARWRAERGHGDATVQQLDATIARIEDYERRRIDRSILTIRLSAGRLGSE